MLPPHTPPSTSSTHSKHESGSVFSLPFFLNHFYLILERHFWAENSVCARVLSHVQLFWDPMDCSLPGSSVHGIFQARISGVSCRFLLQGDLPDPGTELASPALAGRSFSNCANWEAHLGSPETSTGQLFCPSKARFLCPASERSVLALMVPSWFSLPSGCFRTSCVRSSPISL